LPADACNCFRCRITDELLVRGLDVSTG
jgi:hypothetical protein